MPLSVAHDTEDVNSKSSEKHPVLNMGELPVPLVKETHQRGADGIVISTQLHHEAEKLFR